MLSETAIRAAKPREKTYKLSNERGLYLRAYQSDEIALVAL